MAILMWKEHLGNESVMVVPQKIPETVQKHVLKGPFAQVSIPCEGSQQAGSIPAL